MNGGSVFFDTNVLLYLLSADATKANRAEQVLSEGGRISIQVLSEFASVALRKFGMSLAETREVIDVLRSICAVEPLTLQTHDRGLAIGERYGFSVYDSMVIASALLADCRILLSEDLQHAQTINGTLTIQNPFTPNP
jgi:predicted nucleic acid-binding protein